MGFYFIYFFGIWRKGCKEEKNDEYRFSLSRFDLMKFMYIESKSSRMPNFEVFWQARRRKKHSLELIVTDK